MSTAFLSVVISPLIFFFNIFQNLSNVIKVCTIKLETFFKNLLEGIELKIVFGKPSKYMGLLTKTQNVFKHYITECH